MCVSPPRGWPRLPEASRRAASGVDYATGHPEVKGGGRPPRDLGAPVTYHRGPHRTPSGMVRRSRSRLLLVALAVAAIVVAGCGGAGKVATGVVLKEAVAASEASAAAGTRASFTSAVPRITARSSPVIAG